MANQKGKELEQQLIIKYEQYIRNTENGVPGERRVVREIAESPITPEDIKKRANALLKITGSGLAK